MARHAQIVFGIEVPDYLTNRDVYGAADEASQTLREHHIDVTDAAIDGLIFEEDHQAPIEGEGESNHG